MITTGIPAIDEARVEAFVGQAVADMGAAVYGLLLLVVFALDGPGWPASHHRW